jgi:hypothetical protein
MIYCECTQLSRPLRRTLYPVLVHLDDHVYELDRVAALALRLADLFRVPPFTVNEAGYV